MGLDGVELVIEVEEQFGIEIADAEAESVQTVGDLYALVQAKGVVGDVRTPCVLRPVFRKLTRAIDDTAPGPSPRWRPSTPLRDVFGPGRTVEIWPRLERATGWRMPELVRPRALVWASIVLSVSAAVTAAAWIAQWIWSEGWDVALSAAGVIGLFVGAFVGMGLVYATRCTRRCAPADTLGEFTRLVKSKNGPAIAADYGGISEDDAWATIRQIVVEVLGVRPEEVRPEARFIKDLGMN
ncbi:MAG: hypothetical protein AAFX76_04405 [Planctomycetota bacterium]